MSRLAGRGTAGAAILLGVAASLVSGGCVTLGTFEALEVRVSELELDRARLQASMAEDVNRLENLHAKLTEAEETLRKSGTNLGLRVEQLESAAPRIQGELEAMAFRMKGLAQDVQRAKKELFERLGATSVFLPPDLPKDASAVWALARKKGAAGDSLEAQALYDHFEASWPSDPRADDALVARAKLVEADGDVAGAIKLYQAVHDRYPGGDLVTSSLWRIGELFEARGDCKRAKGVYDYLVRSFAESAEGVKAKDRAKVVLKDCRER